MCNYTEEKGDFFYLFILIISAGSCWLVPLLFHIVQQTYGSEMTFKRQSEHVIVRLEREPYVSH